MKSPLLLLDMDGTMANWVDSFLPKTSIDCVHKLNKHPERTSIIKKVYEDHPNIFQELKVIDAFKVLKDYIEKVRLEFGFHIGILSSIGKEHHDPDTVRTDKLQWLKDNKEHLPFINPNFIFFVNDSEDKIKYAGVKEVVLVDDWKRNCDEFKQNGSSAICLGELGLYDPHEKGQEVYDLCKSIFDELTIAS